MSTPVPFLLIFELVLQLVSDDTVGDWLGWTDSREEWAITMENWKERVDMSSKGPRCAAFSLRGDTAPCHTGFDSVLLLAVRQRLWFVALSQQELCTCGCGGRHTLEPCWNVAKWCFDHMLRGCVARRRHDGEPWLASDRWRATCSGRSSPPRAAMLQFRGNTLITEPSAVRLLDGSEPSRCMAKDVARPR